MKYMTMLLKRPNDLIRSFLNIYVIIYIRKCSMKDKILTIILGVLIIVIISAIIIFNNVLNEYNKTYANINDEINNTLTQIKQKEQNLSNLKIDNEIKGKQKENITNYINVLEQKVKEYE